MNRVDVVVPCYNYAHFLEQCVTSVVTQELVHTRVLIIDDCSSDNTAQIANGLLNSLPNVQYRRHEQNQGHIATYNEGLLHWAESEFVLLLSADDVLAPGALNRATSLMQKDASLGFVWGRQIEFEDVLPQLPTAKNTPFEYEIYTGQQFIEHCCSNASNPVRTPTAVLRTTLQQEVGGYRPELPHSGDLEIWLRCSAYAGVGEINDVQAFKREHASNMIKSYVPDVLPDLQQRYAAFRSALNEHKERVHQTDQLLAGVKSRLANDAIWAAHEMFESDREDRCSPLLAFALEMDPTSTNSPAMRKLQWKRRLGSKIWNFAAPALKSLRGR